VNEVATINPRAAKFDTTHSQAKEIRPSDPTVVEQKKVRMSHNLLA